MLGGGSRFRGTLLVACAAPALALGAPAGGASDPLTPYLSSSFSPVHESALRVRFVGNAVDGWLTHGDPPFLGQIAARCRAVRGLDVGVRLARLAPPARLQATHRRLVDAFARVRSGCKEARASALAVRAKLESAAASGVAAQTRKARGAEAAYRRWLGPFRVTVRAHEQAVAAWRSAVLAYAAELGVEAPAWVKDL